MKKIKFVSLAKIAIIIAIIFIIYNLLPNVEAKTLVEKIRSYGQMASVVYVLMWIILPMIAVPMPVIALSGGLIFGIVQGFILSTIGIFFNMTLMYFLMDKLSKKRIRNFINENLPDFISKRLGSDDQDYLKKLFFILRILPMVSYTLINYLAGMVGIDYKNYIGVSMVGQVPSTLIYLNLGDKILDPHSTGFTLSIVIIVVFVVISLIITKVYLPEDN